MKTKKIVVLLILVLGISYYIHDTYYAKKNLSAPNIPLDLSGDTNEKKSYNSNIKPFNTIKTRIFGESKYAVQKLLGKPNKVLSSQMYSSWSVLIYYRKVRDEFDNDKVKHLAVWIERDNRLNSKVTKVKCVTPNSYLRVGTSKIKLP
ncbi:hypothetical protein [uncultured Tenacibaculum sp.]|uniref:hypothetical protein n=1 Tax=uncultured Tenacibaculum sp. TaxID=174713 RepID=UPI002605BFC6|nr:hypothetical protein [uncultured Tenacibaculum sp.]